MKEYEAKATITRDDSQVTIVSGEVCKLIGVIIKNDKAYADLSNSQNNILSVPLDVLEKFFIEK